MERLHTNWNVSVDDGALFKEGPREEVATLMYDVVSACMAIGDLAYGSRGYQPLTFADEVAKLLTVNDCKFEKNYTVKGKSLTEYHIDFSITKPRRVSYVQAMGVTTPSGVKAWVNATYRMWGDIETGRGKVVRKVSLLNDEIVEVRKEDFNLLKDVSTVYRWGEQSEFIASLTNGHG